MLKVVQFQKGTNLCMFRWNYIFYILYNCIFFIQTKLGQYEEIFNKFLNYVYNVKSCTVSKRDKSLFV